VGTPFTPDGGGTGEARAAADLALDLARECWALDPGGASAAAPRDTAITALRRAAALLSREERRDLNVEVSLGLLLCQRNRFAPGAGDWDEAISLLSEAVPALLSGVEPEPAFAAAVAGDLGWALAGRLEDEPEPATLDAAVHWLGTAVELADIGQPQAASETSWPNRRLLAELLRRRFISTGSREDIERAIAQVRALLEALPADTPGSAEVRCELVDLYFCRTASMTDDQDIDDLIAVGLESLDAVPSDSAERARIAAITGVVIAGATRRPTRHGRLGSETDKSIDLLREAYGRLPADSTWRPAVVREYGAMLVARAEAHENLADLRRGIKLLTEALGLFGDGDPVRAETAAALGGAMVRGAYRGLPEADPGLAIGLLNSRPTEGIEDPAERGSRLDSAGLAYVLRARRTGSPGDLDRGIDCHVRALRAYPCSHPGYARATCNLATALLERYGQRGDLSDLDAATGHLDRLLADLDPQSPQWRQARLARGECIMSRPPGMQDREEFDDAIALSRQLTEQLPVGHPLRPQYLNNLITALLLRFGQREDTADAKSAAELAVSMAEGLPGDHAERATLLTSAAVAVWAGGELAGMSDQRSRSLAYLSDAVQASGADDPQRGRRLAALGVALLTPRGHRASDPLPMPLHGVTAGERDQAIGYLSEAAALLAETPGRRMAASVLMTLARLRRARADQSRDDNGQARRAGLGALAVHRLGVFLQGDTPNALARARAAAADAAEVATWCLADYAVAEAVAALESGRGLVLHAATTAFSVAERLRSVGEHALAEEWLREPKNYADEPEVTLAGLLQPDYVPSALRQRVLAALARERPQSAPLAMPTLPEVTMALSQGGHDALVYLLPATSGAPGAAVIVRPSGEATVLALPEVVVTPGSPIGRYASAHAGYRTRSLGSLTHQLRMAGRWGAALREIISWAGTAVIDGLLAAVGHRIDGGPPRLVLVPFGVLGMIPWHAALVRDGTAGATGPALRRAVFSYAASARQFGEAMARPRLPWAQAPAFVVNPLLDLPWASAEARAIRSAHCPDAPFLGYLAEGQERDVAPTDVLALLPGTDTAGASLLHVSCHGRTAGSPLDSALLLSSWQELTVGGILRQARTRPPDSPGGLVVLAACLSDLTNGDHDEALTLATTFLSAGAASVIGTQWEVSDARTAVLMFMTYEFLRVEGGRPADALRAAQLWMLDPARAIPADMPPELAAEASRQVLDDPAAWAGFVHHGW
jgi:hypothetical protein